MSIKKSDNENVIKSPLNYTGGKSKLVLQIEKLLPEKIECFYSPFCGSAELELSLLKMGRIKNKLFLNDACKPLMNLLMDLSSFNHIGFYSVDKHINRIIELFCLSKDNKQAYLELRDYYNQQIDKGYNASLHLFLLICHSFSNYTRFNHKGYFNVPFGRRTYNESTQINLEKYMDILNNTKGKIAFSYGDYEKFIFPSDDYEELYSGNDFIYLDPPYYSTVANYNVAWSKDEQDRFLAVIERLLRLNVKLAISGNFKKDYTLEEFSEKHNLNVHLLSKSYANCSYNKLDRGGDLEVLVTNY